MKLTFLSFLANWTERVWGGREMEICAIIDNNLCNLKSLNI